MQRAFILLCCIVSYLFSFAQEPEWTSKNNMSAHDVSNFPVIRVENAVVTEGDNGGCYMVLLLSLNKRSMDPVKVQYQTSGSSDPTGEDFLQKKGTITFPANRLLQTVKIQVDCAVHATLDKTFYIKLSGIVNAAPEPITATGKIDDTQAVPAVSLRKNY